MQWADFFCTVKELMDLVTILECVRMLAEKEAKFSSCLLYLTEALSDLWLK